MHEYSEYGNLARKIEADEPFYSDETLVFKTKKSHNSTVILNCSFNIMSIFQPLNNVWYFYKKWWVLKDT